MMNSGRRGDCDQNGRRLAVVASEHLTGRIGLHDGNDVRIVLVSFGRRRRRRMDVVFERSRTFDFGFHHHRYLVVVDQRLRAARRWWLLVSLLRLRLVMMQSRLDAFRPRFHGRRSATPRPVTWRATNFALPNWQ